MLTGGPKALPLRGLDTDTTSAPPWPLAGSPVLGRSELALWGCLQHLIHCKGSRAGGAGIQEREQQPDRLGRVQVRCRCGAGRVEQGAGSM